MPSAFANIAASQTDSSIVAARTNMKVRVLALHMSAGGTATNVTFNTKPTGAGTAISPLFALPINGERTLPHSSYNRAWLETGKGEGLTVTTGAGATTGILVVYDYMPS